MIRQFHHLDMPYLWALHREQRHPYPFPILGEKFAEILVAVDDNDVPVQAALARKTVEVYWIGHPTWRTPAWRVRFLLGLHEAMHGALKAAGFTDAQCVLPPRIAQAFGRRLMRDFGWVAMEWKAFCKYL